MLGGLALDQVVRIGFTTLLINENFKGEGAGGGR